MAKWKEIADKNARYVWMCPDPHGIGCKETAKLSPKLYRNNGTPFCAECATYMGYVKTEIKE